MKEFKKPEESKEERKVVFGICDANGETILETDDLDEILIAIAMLEQGIDPRDEEEEDCCGECSDCGRCSCCDDCDDEDDEDEEEEDDDDFDEDDDDDDDDCLPFHGTGVREVELFRVTIDPEKILKAAAVVGGLVALRKIWKRMKG